VNPRGNLVAWRFLNRDTTSIQLQHPSQGLQGLPQEILRGRSAEIQKFDRAGCTTGLPEGSIAQQPTTQQPTELLQPIAAASTYAYPSPAEFTQFKKTLKPSPVALSTTDRKLRQDFQAEWQKKNRAIAPYVGAWKTADNQDVYVFPSTVSQRACVVRQKDGQLEMKLAVSMTADMRFDGNTGMFRVDPMTDVVAGRSDKSEPLSALYGAIGSPEVSASVREELGQAGCVSELPKKSIEERKVVRTYRNSAEFARLHLGWDDHTVQMQKARHTEFGVFKSRADSFFEELKFFKLDQNPACVIDVRGVVDSSLGCHAFSYLNYLQLRQHLAAQNSIINTFNSPELLKPTSGVISYSSLRSREDVSAKYFDEFLSQSREEIGRRVNEPKYNGIFGIIQPQLDSLKKNTSNSIVQTSFLLKSATSTGLQISPDVLAPVTGNIVSELEKTKNIKSILKLVGVLAVESASLIPDLYSAFSPASGTEKEREKLTKELGAAYVLKLASLAGELSKDPIISKLEVFVELQRAIALHETLEKSYDNNSLEPLDRSILQLYWILTSTKIVGGICQLIPHPSMDTLGGFIKAGATSIGGIHIASSSRQFADQYKIIEDAVKKNDEILGSYEKAYLVFYDDLTDAYLANYPTVLRKESDGRITSTTLELLKLE
jgi:hypothetical protein